MKLHGPTMQCAICDYMVMSFLTGCFCVWMLLGFPKALRQEPKRVAFRLAKRNQRVQCEIEYDEMSHISYQLHLEQEDKARLEDSFKREIETLESYAQVMKDTSETNKEDANKFLSQLKTLKVRLQDVEQTLTAKIQEVIELERQIYQVQDSLDRANQANANMRELHDHKIEFRREVYAINKANRFHLFDDCNVLMQARPITMYVCKECEVRRESENAEMGQYQHGWR